MYKKRKKMPKKRRKMPKKRRKMPKKRRKVREKRKKRKAERRKARGHMKNGKKIEALQRSMARVMAIQCDMKGHMEMLIPLRKITQNVQGDLENAQRRIIFLERENRNIRREIRRLTAWEKEIWEVLEQIQSGKTKKPAGSRKYKKK